MTYDLAKDLQPLLLGDDLIDVMTCLPEYSAEIQSAPAQIRLLALSDIYSVYIPSPMSTEIYSKLYISMLHSLKKKVSKDIVRQYYNNYRTIKGSISEGIIGGTDSFTIVGASGIGKSTAVSKSLPLISSNLIRRDHAVIAPCVLVQCPFDCSVKGLLIEILRKVDELLETQYYTHAIKTKATTDMLVGSVSQVAINHIGLLIVDEIQHVVSSKNGSVLVGALTQLINSSGISIGMVGTPECEPFFASRMQLARRSLGLSYAPLPFDTYFVNLCKTLWRFQYTKHATPFSDQVAYWIYEHSGGLVSVAVSLIHDAQEIAILNEKEMLDIETLSAAYQRRLGMLHGFIVPGREKKYHKSVYYGSTVPELQEGKTDNNDNSIETLVSLAKTMELDAIDLLKKTMQVEEVRLC